MERSWSRRRLLAVGAGALVAVRAPASASPQLPALQADKVGERLAPWRPGTLDIHHIATGRGDAALVIGPTGESLLIDAGATASPLSMSVAPMPGPERRAGEWIARYALRCLAPVGRGVIDAALVTHIHPDHLGDVTDASPLATDGSHRLTGLSDVDARIPIGRVIDRDFPGYDWPATINAPYAANYRAYINARTLAGRKVERLRVGAADQLLSPQPGFEARIIAGNGEVWTGEGDRSRSVVPPLASLPREEWPDENVLSAAVRIRMGGFAYYGAGDLSCNSHDGAQPWRDVGTEAAKACGTVDVAVAPHHGMWDGVSGNMVRALQPRIWIIQAWHVSHPNLSALERMMSRRLYPAERDMLATGLTEAGALVNQRLVDRFAVQRGHIVVRVDAGGENYRIVAADNRDEEDRVTAVLGPFPASQSAL